MKKIESQKGITLVALVVTIIVLIILAGISINLLLGDNGLITRAQEAKKQQKIAEVKEKLSLELSAAETDAILRNESLEEEQLNDIISKYGTLQDDKDTILTKDDNYEISLKEIWYGTLSTSGSYSDKKKQIEILENQLKELEEKYDNLKKEYDKFVENPGTATEGDIAKGKTAWVNGILISGTGNTSEGFSSKDKIDTYGFGENSSTGTTTWYAVPRVVKNMSSSGNYFVITVPGTYWITADALNAPYLFINDKQTSWNMHNAVGAGGYYYLTEGTTVMAHSHGYGWSCSMQLLKISDDDITQ